jgi:hypothetical protein
MQLAPFCLDAGASAAQTQRAFLRFHLVQLGLLVLAAIAGATSWVSERPPVDWSGILAATFFGIGLLLRIVMMQRKDEDAWYAARNAAEVSKSLCFQYAYGATGYARSDSQKTADARFIDAFGTIGRDVLLARSSARTDGYSEITDDMREARRLPFAEAKAQYFRERIADQERWYSAKSAFHLRRARLFMLLMLVAQVAGLFFSLLKAVAGFGDSFSGVVGILSAFAAAFVAWAQLRQHSMLAATYQAQAVDLRDFGRRIELVDESDWPDFVSAVEGALIAEHTRWQGFQGFR